MQEAGTVLHLARSGRLILKATAQIRDGTPLVDETGRRTGRVMETIGPVMSPYLSVQPMTDRIERLIGSKLFVSENAESGYRERASHFSAESRRFKSNKRPRSAQRTDPNRDDRRRSPKDHLRK